MTCKDCVHYEVCKDACENGYSDEDENGNYFTDACTLFKNKADFAEVVRCKDCKFKKLMSDGTTYACLKQQAYRKPTDFCSYGDRRTDNDI